MKKFIIALLFVGLVAVGYWRFQSGQARQSPAEGSQAASSAAPASQAQSAAGKVASASLEGLVAALPQPPSILPAATYVPKDGVIDVEISEYAGYAGLIHANGGLEPSESSWFFRNHGFKLRIKLSESENWAPLNGGRIGVSVTTADVLALYANQLQVAVPVQLSYSRGADSIVVDRSVKRINDLKGRTLLTSQFGEAEFLLRYLAQEASLPVANLSEGQRPRPDSINLRYAEDPFVAGDLYLANMDTFSGFIGWEPKVGEVVAASQGRAHVLVDNRNLLIIADVLLVNKGFAQQNPKIVQGLVEGVLAGNDALRTSPEAGVPLLKKAFGWDEAKTRAQLAKVHLSNHPENLAFFRGATDAAGSFSSIYQTSLYAFADFAKHNVGADRFIDTRALEAVQSRFASQVANIAPIRSTQTAGIEGSPLLSRNVRFLFEPNSYALQQSTENNRYYADIKRLLDVSPGSTVLLRGHVDNAQVEDFRRQGGEALVRKMAMSAVQLSRDRANAVKGHLVKEYGIAAECIEILGRGWDEPLGGSDENRRVEVYWFTVE